MGDTAAALEYYNKGLKMLIAAPSDNPEDIELRESLRRKINQLSKNPKIES
jgi:hypothetical protein